MIIIEPTRPTAAPPARRPIRDRRVVATSTGPGRPGSKRPAGPRRPPTRRPAGPASPGDTRN